MIQLLIDNPLLLLFVVAAIGYPLGRIRIRGINLDVANNAGDLAQRCGPG
jgi:putative transport protein